MASNQLFLETPAYSPTFKYIRPSVKRSFPFQSSTFTRNSFVGVNSAKEVMFFIDVCLCFHLSATLFRKTLMNVDKIFRVARHGFKKQLIEIMG